LRELQHYVFSDGWEHKADGLKAAGLIALIRSLLRPADFSHFWIAALPLTSLWESDKFEGNLGPAEELIRPLIEAVNKGGNLLLN